MNEKFEPFAKPCVRFEKSRQATRCFIGGCPHLHEHQSWPRRNGRPLAFVAQVSLADIQRAQHLDWLPNAGRLSFFYDIETGPWGFDPQDAGSAVVLLTDESERTVEVQPPDDLDREFQVPNQVYLMAKAARSYPPPGRECLDNLALSDDEYEAYEDWFFDQEGGHQIGGFPAAVQNDDMEEQAHLAANGVYCGNPEGYQTDHAKAMRALPYDWRLLLQLDTDSDADIMWGDSGMLYFWARPQETTAGDFSSPWVILQCC